MENKKAYPLAVEFSKRIINECLERNLEINTHKLEKLLIIMQGKMLTEHNRPLFTNKIVATNCCIYIPDVDKEFIQYALGCHEKQLSSICLLKEELDVVTKTLDWYEELGSDFIEDNTYLKYLTHHSLKNVNNEPHIVPNEFIEYVFLFSPEYLQSCMSESDKCC